MERTLPQTRSLLFSGVDYPDMFLQTWSEAYAEQTEQGHARLVQAIKSGKIMAIKGTWVPVSPIILVRSSRW